MLNISKNFIKGICFCIFFSGFLYAPVFALEDQAGSVIKEFNADAPDVLARYQEIADKYKNDGQNEIVLKNGIVFHPYDYEITHGVLSLMFKGERAAPKEFETAFVLPLLEVETINKAKVDPVEANFGMATFYLGEKKDFNIAIGYLEKTLALDPGYQLALIDLGSAYNHVGRFADSLRMGQKAVERYPDNKKLWFNLAVAYMKEGQFSQAEESYGKAIAIDPDFGEVYMNLGVLYLDQGRTQEAKIAFAAAKKRLAGKGNEQRLEMVEQILADIENDENVSRGLEKAAAGQPKQKPGCC